MRINAELIVKLRKDKAWSQDELAIACPACKSDNIYQYKEYFQYTGNGEELLPGLGKGMFGVAQICPFVCGECGNIRHMASSETRENLSSSKHWKKV